MYRCDYTFFLRIRRPPRSTLVPYTTLFRSVPAGLPASRATRVRPAVTASQTYSKCGVPPRMTTPSATTASCRSVSAWATTGSSTAPGTRTTVGSGTPLATAAATARSSSAPVISACQVVATMPRVSPDASTACASGAPLPLTRPPRRRSSAAFPVPLLCSSVDPRRSQPLLRPAQRDVGARHGRGVGRTGLGLRLDDVQQVPHPVALGAQVGEVLRGDVAGQRHPAGHLQPVALQAGALGRVVGEQPHRVHAEVDEDLCAGAVVAGVGRQAQVEVGVDGVDAPVLQLVGLQLVQQADPPALVPADVEHDPAALLRHRGQRRLQLRAAVAAQGAEDVT